ncbi:ComF family protein [Shewanella marisflavi]|uniref:ComF family protein n=1 Tax=Shewanella marisflavi TaxID=260364 RepID=UPI003AAC98DC
MKTATWSQGNLNYVCDYPPYWIYGESKTHNPHRTQDTYRVMDMKNPDSRNYQTSLRHFQGKLLGFFRRFPELERYAAINLAIIPSSTAGKESVPLRAIVQHLNLNLPQTIRYNPQFLVRTYSVPSAHEGGQRNEQIHLDSIVVGTDIEPNVPLILLDDVYTTGSSMNACTRLLREAGVEHIYQLVLGKTV